MLKHEHCVHCGKDLGMRDMFLFEMSACRPCAAKNNRDYRNHRIEMNRKIIESQESEGLLETNNLWLHDVPPIDVIPEEFRIPEDYEWVDPRPDSDD